jgi:hypothetical protein
MLGSVSGRDSAPLTENAPRGRDSERVALECGRSAFGPTRGRQCHTRRETGFPHCWPIPTCSCPSAVHQKRREFEVRNIWLRKCAEVRTESPERDLADGPRWYQMVSYRNISRTSRDHAIVPSLSFI